MLTTDCQQCIELCGDTGCGKTQYLTHVIANAIMPATFRRQKLGGLGTSVIVIDVDHLFSLQRLVSMLEARLLQSSLASVQDDRNGLERMHGAQNSCSASAHIEHVDCLEYKLPTDCLAVLQNSDSKGVFETKKVDESLCTQDLEEFIMSCLARFANMSLFLFYIDTETIKRLSIILKSLRCLSVCLSNLINTT